MLRPNRSFWILLALLPDAAMGQEAPLRSLAHNTFLPVLGSAPETGFQYGATWLRTFRRGPDATTRVSQFQLTAVGTAKSQRRLSGTVDVWSAGNARRNRIRAEYLHFPLAVYAIGAESPEDAKGSYTSAGVDVQWLGQQRIMRGVYVGTLLRFDGLRSSDEDFSEWNRSIAQPPQKTRNQVRAQAMGTFDTRDHQNAAQKGTFAQFTGSVAAESNRGKADSWTKYGVDMRHYRPVGIGGVLAAQATVEALASRDGSPDFLPAIGADSMMRGFVRSRFRDNAAAAVQAEYRSGYWRHLGVTVFSGAATLGSSLRDLGSHGLITSFGAGLRYQLSQADRSRIRIDYARGRHGGALYVALGEAF